MVFTTFNNPACLPPRDNQQNIPPTRETTLCLTPNKQNVLQYKKNSSNQTKKQLWTYLSNINPPKGKTYATQNDLGSNPNSQNLPRTGGGGMIDTCTN
jgi:hypothetical protein